MKVKEVLPPEYGKVRRGQTICGFHQLTADREQLEAALASGATYLVYHTVGEPSGRYPILSPMSAIAGRLAVQVGAWCLQRQNGGSGVLLSGVDGVPPGKYIVLVSPPALPKPRQRPKGWPPLNEKYGRADRSPLKFEVEKKANVLNLSVD